MSKGHGTLPSIKSARSSMEDTESAHSHVDADVPDPQHQRDLDEAAQGSTDLSVILRVGKHYLKQAEAGCNPGENGKLAVKWLVKASRDGNEEATDLLARCLENQIGIDNDNVNDVSWCLETSSLEKSVRLGAKKLFHAMNPMSNYMARDHLPDGLEKIAADKAERKLIEKSCKLKNKDCVSEAEFEDNILRKIQGSGGITISSILQSDVEIEAYKASSLWSKVTMYPGKSLVLLADQVVETASKQGMSWVRSMIPTQQVHMLLVFFLYSFLSIEAIIFILPLMIFYLSYLAMIISTMQMFYGQRKLKDIKALATMLKRFNEAIESETADSSYRWETITPYITYFVTLLLTVMSFNWADKSWIFCSECVFIALFFAVTCFVALSSSYDWLIILSVFSNILSTLPTIFEQFPRIPIVYHLINLFTGTVVSVEILQGIYINFGIPSLAYMIVPFLFLRMAAKESGKGTLRILIPHLVCFFWWQLAVQFFRCSTWFGLLRGSVGWIALAVLLPVIGVGILGWLVLYCFRMFSFGNILKVITTLTLLAIPAVLGIWVNKGFKYKGFGLDSKTTKGKILLVLLGAFSFIPLVYIFVPPERDVGGHYLTWDQYRKFCSKPQWDVTNIADAEIKCVNFRNTIVSWSGTINKIKVNNVENPAESVLRWLPVVVSNWLRCVYGEQYPDCYSLTSPEEQELCQLRTMQGQQCHMNNMNHYTYEMWITMAIDNETTQDVRVLAGHWFTKPLMKLKSGDQVTFRAALQSGIGGEWVYLKLYYITCSDCPLLIKDDPSDTDPEKRPLLKQMQHAFYSSVNFIVAPVIEFRV